MLFGYGGSGKDSICRILYEIFGLTYASSSHFAMELFLFDLLNNKYGFDYQTKEDCYSDRHNKRQIWYEEIKAYNTPDGSRLARDLYNRYNIYNGVRNIHEFLAIKDAKLFDHAIWIDAGERIVDEDITSCTVKPIDADIILDNNGPLYQTTQTLIELVLDLYPQLR